MQSIVGSDTACLDAVIVVLHGCGVNGYQYQIFLRVIVSPELTAPLNYDIAFAQAGSYNVTRMLDWGDVLA